MINTIINYSTKQTSVCSQPYGRKKKASDILSADYDVGKPVAD